MGSALPIMTTLTDLLDTGDTVNTITGCVSGTLAYVLRTMHDDSLTFSEALRGAVSKEYTQYDLRDDLSGLETARNVQ